MFSKIGTGMRGAPPVFPLDTPLFRGDVIIATPETADRDLRHPNVSDGEGAPNFTIIGAEMGV